MTKTCSRKPVERKNIMDEGRYETLFNQSNDAIIFHSLKGRILDLNESAMAMFGHYDKTKLLKKSILSLYIKEDTVKIRKALNIISKGGSIRFETKLIKKDLFTRSKSIINVDVSSIVVDRDEGLVVEMIRDITDMKNAENALRKRSEELQDANDGLLNAFFDESFF